MNFRFNPEDYLLPRSQLQAWKRILSEPRWYEIGKRFWIWMEKR